MALKTKKSDNNTRKKRRSRDNFFMSEKFKFIFGIFILLIAAYLLIAFISFIFYGPDDHSSLDLPLKELIWNSEVHVSNKAGKTGAYLSDLIMNRGFGFASFIFIYLLTITGLRILGRKIFRYKRNILFFWFYWSGFRYSWVLYFLKKMQVHTFIPEGSMDLS